MNCKRVLFVLFLTCFACAKLATAQLPIFNTLNTFPAYQPGGNIYEPILALAGDFNGDGTPDLAYIEDSTQGASDDYLVIAFGASGGAPRQVGTDLQACSARDGMAAGDVNGDHHLDLVILCSQGYVATLLGNGDGTFQAQVLSPMPNGSYEVVLADFNGDGLLDAVFLSYDPSIADTAISLNLGGGKFGASTAIDAPLGQSNTRLDLVAGDFNGDGKQDLASPEGYVLGNGDGTFGQQQSLPAGISHIAAGDFNHDGFTDLAYSLSVSTTSPLYLINGSSAGLTSTPTAITVDGYGSSTLQAVDITRNGALDLVTVLNSGGLSILPGNGDGTFSLPNVYANPGNVFADINGDGIPDLVAISNYGSNGYALGVSYGNGDGTLLKGIPMTILAAGETFGSTGDMNGDGLPDAVVKSPVTINNVSHTAPQMYLSNGDGRFTPAPMASTISTGDYGTFIEMADFNGDGRPDVVSISPGLDNCPVSGGCSGPGPVPGPGTAQLLFYRGNGDGTLTYLNETDLGVEGINSVATGDFNQDGKQDSDCRLLL
jgi:hypothetical protein